MGDWIQADKGTDLPTILELTPGKKFHGEFDFSLSDRCEVALLWKVLANEAGLTYSDLTALNVAFREALLQIRS